MAAIGCNLNLIAGTAATVGVGCVCVPANPNKQKHHNMGDDDVDDEHQLLKKTTDYSTT